MVWVCWRLIQVCHDMHDMGLGESTYQNEELDLLRNFHNQFLHFWYSSLLVATNWPINDVLVAILIIPWYIFWKSYSDGILTYKILSIILPLGLEGKKAWSNYRVLLTFTLVALCEFRLARFTETWMKHIICSTWWTVWEAINVPFFKGILNWPLWSAFHQSDQLQLLMLCYAVACPHLERSGISTACPRSASAHLYHADGRLTSCDGAATECI